MARRSLHAKCGSHFPSVTKWLWEINRSCSVNNSSVVLVSGNKSNCELCLITFWKTVTEFRCCHSDHCWSSVGSGHFACLTYLYFPWFFLQLSAGNPIISAFHNGELVVVHYGFMYRTVLDGVGTLCLTPPAPATIYDFFTPCRLYPPSWWCNTVIHSHIVSPRPPAKFPLGKWKTINYSSSSSHITPSHHTSNPLTSHPHISHIKHLTSHILHHT